MGGRLGRVAEYVKNEEDFFFTFPGHQAKLLFGAGRYRKGEAMSVEINTIGLNKIG
jgi:hypothetical protein